MRNKLLLLVITILASTASKSLASSFLSEEQIHAAQELGKSGTFCEDFRKLETGKEANQRKDYLTLENYSFQYKDNTHKLLIAVGFYHDSCWGEIAVYPENVDPKTIRYSLGEFSDLGRATPYLATIKFEYEPASEQHPAYFILEKVDAGHNAGRKGYSQACTSYFISKFITNHTKVDFVFSDARNVACQVFFPRYGLQSGMPESFKTVKFSRPSRFSYYWERKK